MFDKLVYQKALEQDLENFSKLNLKYLDQVFSLSVDNLKQRREFIKHITLITLGILAFAPLFQEKVKIHLYFNIGLILEFFVIFLALIRLREELDKEGNDLQKQSINSSKIDEMLDLVREYIIKDLTEENYQEWFAKRKALQSSLRKKDIRKNENMDYFIEFILSVLILGIALILASILLSNILKWYYFGGIILSGFIFTIFIPTKFFVVPINFLLNLGKDNTNKN
jgi:hypothetical protein